MSIKANISELNGSSVRIQRGFTIVELLIVIVVIAILATLTIVAYNGIQQRAQASAASTALSQASKKLKAYEVDNGLYPTQLSDAGITNSSTTYQYTVNNSTNPKTFCITATNGTTSYYITSTSIPTSGGCAGHGQGGVAAVTNLLPNPSFEINTTGWGVANGATITRQATSAINYGSFGARVVSGNNTSDSGIAANATLTAGRTYTYSASVRAVTAGSYMMSIQGVAGPGWQSNQTRNMAAGEIFRFGITWTAPASGSAALYVLRPGSSGPSMNNFDVDGMMLVEGVTNTYTDPSINTNWVWNGVAHSSTSTGPSP